MWPGNGRIINFVSSSQLFLCSLHNQEGLSFRPHVEVHGMWMLFRHRQKGQAEIRAVREKIAQQ